MTEYGSRSFDVTIIMKINSQLDSFGPWMRTESIQYLQYFTFDKKKVHFIPQVCMTSTSQHGIKA